MIFVSLNVNDTQIIQIRSELISPFWFLECRKVRHSPHYGAVFRRFHYNGSDRTAIKWTGGKMVNSSEPKYGHECHRYTPVWDEDDFGGDRELSLQTVDRHQNYPNSIYIDAFHMHLILGGHCTHEPIMCPDRPISLDGGHPFFE